MNPINDLGKKVESNSTNISTLPSIPFSDRSQMYARRQWVLRISEIYCRNAKQAKVKFGITEEEWRKYVKPGTHSEEYNEIHRQDSGQKLKYQPAL